MAFALAGLALVVACAVQHDPLTPQTDEAQSSQSFAASVQTGVIQPPPSGAYFGAQVNPSADPSQIETETEALEQQIGRPLVLHNHYYIWGTIFPDADGTDGVNADAQHGRTPVIAWGCSGTLPAITAEATADDEESPPPNDYLIKEMSAIKAYPGRVFIRWFWEANVNDTASVSSPYPSPFPSGAYVNPTANSNTCIDTTTDPATNATNFIAAWKAIHKLFADRGVTNVTWLWNPAQSNPWASPLPLFPGKEFVDWIGNDAYDWFDNARSDDFKTIMQPFADDWAGYGKPLMITETGAFNAAGSGPCGTDNQSAYLTYALNDLQQAPFSAYKAFMYFDGPGVNGCWPFSASGLSGFQAMGQSPYFNAITQGTPLSRTGSSHQAILRPSDPYARGTFLLAYIAVASGSSRVTVAPPSSAWTPIASYRSVNPTTGGEQAIFEHVASGSETAYTFTWSAANDYSALLVPFSGVNVSSPLDPGVPATITVSTPGPALSANAVNPNSGGDYLVTFFNVVAPSPITVVAPTPPTSWSASTTNAQSPYVDLFYAVDPTGVGDGTSSPGAVFAWQNGASHATTWFTAALNPATRP